MTLTQHGAPCFQDSQFHRLSNAVQYSRKGGDKKYKTRNWGTEWILEKPEDSSVCLQQGISTNLKENSGVRAESVCVS